MGEARRRGNLSSVRAKEKVQKESKSVSPAPFASSFPGAAGKSGGVCLVSLFVCVWMNSFFWFLAKAILGCAAIPHAVRLSSDSIYPVHRN